MFLKCERFGKTKESTCHGRERKKKIWQKWNLLSPEHRAGAQSTELRELMESETIQLSSYVTRIMLACSRRSDSGAKRKEGWAFFRSPHPPRLFFFRSPFFALRPLPERPEKASVIHTARISNVDIVVNNGKWIKSVNLKLVNEMWKDETITCNGGEKRKIWPWRK